MNRLNLFEKHISIINLGGKEVILREKNIYDLLTCLDYLAIKDLTGFIDYSQNGLSEAKAIIENVDKYIENFFLLHLPQIAVKTKDVEPEEEGFDKFVRSAMQLVLSFSGLWGIDPLEISQKYTIRQLNEFSKILEGSKETTQPNNSGKANSYKCYTDEYGRKVEEWEEEV